MKKESNYPASRPRHNIYAIGAIAALAGLLFGFDTGVISGAQEFLFQAFGVQEETTANQSLKGFVVSAVPLGALFGALLSGFFAKRFGRNRSIRLTAIMFFIGTLCASLAGALYWVVIGRLLMGCAIGISAMVVPMYLGEVSPPNKRGMLIFLFQLAITLGLFLAFCVNLLFAFWITDVAVNWRWMFAVGLIPSLLLYFGMGNMPLSPRWLLLQGKSSQAKTTLADLFGPQKVQEEFARIQQSLENEGREHGFKKLFSKPFLPLVAVTFGLFVFQQLSGINAIMYYGPQVFENAGFGEKAKFLAQLTMGLTNVLATIFAVSIVDKVGRRPLLFTGFIGMIVCLSVLSYALSSGGSTPPALSLISILLFVLFFAVSLGGVPYILMSEIFPLRMKSAGMAFASCANWGFNILISFTFQLLVGALGGTAPVFALYAGFTIVGCLLAWRFMPETKGCTLEQMEANLYAGKPVRDLGRRIQEPSINDLEAPIPDQNLG